MTNVMKSLAKALLGLFVISIVVVVTAVLVVVSTRPDAPDLNIADTWILVKKDVQRNLQVRVYVVEHVSTTWDPHDVAQNKIIVRSKTFEHQFRWSFNQDFAGGWSEVIHGPDESVAVVLFGNENVVRVVAFSNGRFVYRPDKDELVAGCELTYRAGNPGELLFEVDEADQSGAVCGRTWRWTGDSGFRKVPDKNRPTLGS